MYQTGRIGKPKPVFKRGLAIADSKVMINFFPWREKMRHPFKRSDPQPADGEPTRADCPQLVGADIAGVVHGQRVGGDFYQFVRANPRRVLFGLLDVAGVHTENRGIVAAVNETFREKGPPTLASDDLNEADAMMEFCHELNVSIRGAASGIRSCAAFVGCYNEERGTVCYVNAGHTPALLRFNSDISELPATGLPLGLFAASTYEAPTAAVPAGGALLLVSRGVVEATHKKEEFGLERLKQQFGLTPLTSAHGVASAALQAVRHYAQAAALQNDLTTLALVRPA